MSSPLLLVFCLFPVLVSCYSAEDRFLDPGIPRVETPNDKIACVRTKWYNNEHVETAFLDKQDRVLELFRFGVVSSKYLNKYEGANNLLTITYRHDDSSPLGYVSIDTLRRVFDSEGRVVAQLLSGGSNNGGGFSFDPEYRTKRSFSYTATGDTIVKILETTRKDLDLDSSRHTRIDRWEHDAKHRLVHHYRMYSWYAPPNHTDTSEHFSRRFAYDSSGKSAMTRYDYMYMGEFYWSPKPDTTWYLYDSNKHLVTEIHRFTTDMSNKGEPITKDTTDFQKESRLHDRERFFKENNKTDTVKYVYEVFMPEKHHPLKIPTEF